MTGRLTVPDARVMTGEPIRDPLADRLCSQRARRAARHYTHDVLGVAAVGQDPRPAAGVEDSRQPPDALGGMPAAPRIEADADRGSRVVLAAVRHRP